MTSLLSSSNSEDINVSCSCKTAQRKHYFCLKLNLLQNNGTQTTGYVVGDRNKILNAEVTDNNNIIIAVNIPALK